MCTVMMVMLEKLRYLVVIHHLCDIESLGVSEHGGTTSICLWAIWKKKKKKKKKLALFYYICLICRSKWNVLFHFHTVLTTKIYIHPHKPDHVRTSPNTISSDGMCLIKAKSSKNCLKMLSDQKRQKNSGHHQLKFSDTFIDLISFSWLVILVQVVHLGVLNIGLPLEIMFVCLLVFVLYFSFSFFRMVINHHEMNSAHFLEWFEDSLLPTLKKPSVIIIDNSSYHNTRVEGTTAPRANNSKPQMQEWLTTNGIWDGQTGIVECLK